MPSFQEHIDQAQRNIQFLAKINTHCRDFIDWQTTCCFYAALHLINGHVADKLKQNYKTHAQVDAVINPYKNPPSLAALPPEIYATYGLLKNLSRRARYLISHEETEKENRAYLMKEKHFLRAVGYLDIIIDWICSTHNVAFTPLEINCDGLHKKPAKYFKPLAPQKQEIS